MQSILLALLLIGASPSFDVQTLDGKSLSGALRELTPERIKLDAADGEASLETAAVLTISAKEPSRSRPAADVVVELVDGSIINARQFELRASVARISISSGEPIETPAKNVKTVQLQRQETLDAEWTRLARMKADGDVLVVRKGASLDYLAGIVHEVTEEVVRFEVDGDVLPVKRTKVYGLAFRGAMAGDWPAAVCRITDVAGSQWSVQQFTLAETLKWTTPCGVSIAQPLENVVKIDFSAGKLAYLSDLTPDSVAWTPYLSAGKPPAVVQDYFAPRFDRAFDGRPLKLGGVSYAKGLAVKSRTELVYRLPERFRRFQARVGMDDSMGHVGKVRLIIRGDDKELLGAAISGGDAPRQVDLDLSGVRRLTILVDFGESFAAADHLLLCNARLSK